MKAAFVDPTLRFIRYTPYDVIVCSGGYGTDESNGDIEDDSDDEG